MSGVEFWKYKKHLLGLILAGSIVYVCAVFSLGDGHASDARLISRFQQHRQEFDLLAQMAIADNLRHLSHFDNDDVYLAGPAGWQRWHNGGEGFSPERLSEYKTLLGLTNTSIVGRDENGISICCASTVVLRTDDEYEDVVSSKDYRYSESPPGTQLPSLDNVEVRDSHLYCRQIDTNWYLCQEAGVSKPE